MLRKTSSLAVAFVSLHLNDRFFRKAVNEPTTNGKGSTFNCHVPACASKLEMFQSAMQYHADQNKTESEFVDLASNISAPTTSVSKPDLSPPSENDCPIDKEELGRSTWKLIHTIAATIPEYPSLSEQKNIDAFIRTLAALYPCHICAADFQEYVNDFPPR